MAAWRGEASQQAPHQLCCDRGLPDVSMGMQAPVGGAAQLYDICDFRPLQNFNIQDNHSMSLKAAMRAGADFHAYLWVVPCSSMTSVAPAFWCSRSTFWVISASTQPRCCSLARPSCAALGCVSLNSCQPV